MGKVKVLVIDDSSLIRQLLTEIISSADDLVVVATAEDPIDAREKIKQFNPDVLTLDIEMPKMDGITFLKNLMRLRPMPVVMISSLTKAGAPATLDALDIGAVDYIAKPKGGAWGDIQGYAQLIQSKVRSAAKANMAAYDRVVSSTIPTIVHANTAKYKSNKVICIGSSTGGTEALSKVLQPMPDNCPPILIVQHIPAVFSASLAARLNSKCEITVREAKSGMPLEAGNAYLAPGDFHLKLFEKRDRLVTALFDGDKMNGHKPSVDVLFHSVAEHVGCNAVAAILTGMGNDGAAGLKEIFNLGGKTMVQDEISSVVWGMPGSAVKLGAVQEILPIKNITASLLKACEI